MNSNKVIRVLQVGMSPYYGGTESFIMNQYRCINKSRVQFDFLNVYDTEIACQQEIINMGGRIYHLDMSRRHGLRRYNENLKKFFEKYASEFDIVHCNFQSLINIDILKYAKRYHIPVRIAHAHNSGYGKEPNTIQKLIIWGNRKSLNKAATQYFACSKLAAEWMFHRQAMVINNAIDVDQFVYNEEIRKKVRSELGLNDKKVIIFVGRLDPQKNPIFLIDIFAQILNMWKDACLLVVGDGILRENVVDEIKKTGIEAHVRMLGSRKDVAQLLQASDIFLLPSIFEGLGIVLIEAQVAGMYVYTSSNNVPQNVKITNLLEFIPLEKTAAEWAEIIVSKGIERHIDTKEEVCAAGYDNRVNAMKLENLYLKLMRENS